MDVLDGANANGEDAAAVLSELLALLSEDEPPSDETSPRNLSAGRPPLNSTARRKKEIDRLRREAAQLSEQFDRLRATSRCRPHACPRTRASRERHMRRRAEQEREALSTALAQQTAYLNGLYEVFTVAPRLAVVPMAPAHTVIHHIVVIPLPRYDVPRYATPPEDPPRRRCRLRASCQNPRDA